MPELESCSRCGRQVLISVYPWSKQQVGSPICAELDNKQTSIESKNEGFPDIEELPVIGYKHLEPKQELSYKNLEPKQDFELEKSKLSIKNKSNQDQEEILITWSSLLRTIFGLLLFLSLANLGINIWRNYYRSLPINEGIPSKPIN